MQSYFVYPSLVEHTFVETFANTYLTCQDVHTDLILETLYSELKFSLLITHIITMFLGGGLILVWPLDFLSHHPTLWPSLLQIVLLLSHISTMA